VVAINQSWIDLLTCEMDCILCLQMHLIQNNFWNAWDNWNVLNL
jgi:hypothetical protein